MVKSLAKLLVLSKSKWGWDKQPILNVQFREQLAPKVAVRFWNQQVDPSVDHAQVFSADSYGEATSPASYVR